RDPAAAYEKFRGREIAGSTIGVVGFGQIGRDVTRKCLALGARVLVHDPLVDDADINTVGAQAVDLNAVATSSDFITLHVPDDESTERLINRDFLASMRREASLINTSAGSVIDTDALVEALNTGNIAGAALDVFDGQPLPLSSPLLTARNIILTPHIGGATSETIERQSDMMVDEIERFIAGESLNYAV